MRKNLKLFLCIIYNSSFTPSIPASLASSINTRPARFPPRIPRGYSFVSNFEIVERGFSPKGHPPVLPVEAKRQRVNMLSTASSQGEVRFMIYQDAMNQQRLIRFMERLIRVSNRNRTYFTIF